MKRLRMRLIPLTACVTLLHVATSPLGAPAGEVKVVPVTLDPTAAGHAGPARIFGARNGCFSAQIVAPTGALATVTELVGPGLIPAAAISLRYAHPDGPGQARFFDGLHPEPPRQPGAWQPIWITVRVPGDAAGGLYKGKISVGGTQVPVELQVADWRLPDARDFVTHVGLIQSPDSVAMQYGVAMWSQRHWELMGASFALMAQVGAKTLYIPVQRRTHFGNEHGMVIWEKTAASLKPDLALVERYIDLAVQHLGKIPVVCLYVWELDASDASHFPASASKEARTRDRKILVSVKEDGGLVAAEAPDWGTPACRDFWQPLFAGVAAILRRHGMADSLTVGISGDYTPSAMAVQDLAAVAPGVKWVAHAHGRYDQIHGVPTGLQVSVWGLFGLRDPSEPCKWEWQKPRYYGWQRKFPLASFPRYGSIYGNAFSIRYRLPRGSLGLCRSLAEVAIASQGQPKFSPGCSGFDRVGADFWPVLAGTRGATSLCGRYPESSWGALNLNFATPSLLAPGTEGAVGTIRLENMREGLQETEARIFIEKALVDARTRARLGDLADKAEALLDARVRGFLAATRNKGAGWAPWSEGDWQERSAELYGTAAAVAARLR